MKIYGLSLIMFFLFQAALSSFYEGIEMDSSNAEDPQEEAATAEPVPKDPPKSSQSAGKYVLLGCFVIFR